MPKILMVILLNYKTGRINLLVNQLFPNKSDAFWRGFNLLTDQVEQDFDKTCLQFGRMAEIITFDQLIPTEAKSLTR